MGSDLGITGDGMAAWGRNGREIVLLTGIGMSPLEAIEAATANGPATLGRQAPRSGRLEAGFDADVLIVDGDPATEPSLLADPSRITGVWRGGTRVKG
jgi:imidazolonepropionase-like amidohydrolase